MDHFAISVGYTNQRPVIPEERFSWVLVEATSLTEAHLLAAQMVGCHVEMVTSTRLLWAEV